MRRQLSEGQALIRETVDRLRQTQEETEMHARRRDELEGRIATLESEYEELLGTVPVIAYSAGNRNSASIYREDDPRRRSQQCRCRGVNGGAQGMGPREHQRRE